MLLLAVAGLLKAGFYMDRSSSMSMEGRERVVPHSVLLTLSTEQGCGGDATV